VKLGAGSYPEINSLTLNVILLDVYLSSPKPPETLAGGISAPGAI